MFGGEKTTFFGAIPKFTVTLLTILLLITPLFTVYCPLVSTHPRPLSINSLVYTHGTSRSEEEKIRQAERAARFQAMQKAAGIEVPENNEPDAATLHEDELRRLEARANKFGVQINYAPYGEDLGAKFICPRRELEENPDFLDDTLYCYGVDRLSTVGACMCAVCTCCSRSFLCVHVSECMCACVCVYIYMYIYIAG
jgi:hypothetical protein